MFWGRSLRQGEMLSLAEECGAAATLHISHVSLSPGDSSEATNVTLETEGREYRLAVMRKGKGDFQDIDLTFSSGDGGSVSVKGPGQVNFLGYFEAMRSPEGSDSHSSSEEISFYPRPQSPSSSENSHSP